MANQGKRSLSSQTGKSIGLSSGSQNISLDSLKSKAMDNLKGFDTGNLLKGDLSLTGGMSEQDAFNLFANKIVGTSGVDFLSMGINALPSGSSLDAQFFATATDKSKPAPIKEGMILDDMEAVQKFNEFQTASPEQSFNNAANMIMGTQGVNVLDMFAPESSNSPNANTQNDVFARENVLHKYAPYNYNISLSCINKDQYNQGKTDGLLILRSGGAGEESADGLDYYIDNLVIRNTVAPTENSGNASAYQILFDVIEPYGVKFIDTLIQSASAQGYINHMQAIYSLKIDFKGYTDKQIPSNIPDSSRNIPIHIYSVDMVVDAGVTVYKIQAAPAHYAPLMDTYDYTTEDVNCTGNTVGEVINSFFERYSEIQKRQQKDGLTLIPDEFQLLAPGSEQILKSPIGYNENASPNSVQNISISQDGPPGRPGRRVTILKGTSITDFINKIVVESEFYRNKFDDNNNLIDVDGEGFTTALRIFTKSEIIANDNGSGRQAMRVKYILRTQRVSKQHFNFKSNQDLVSNIKASRTYDYLYTGQNKDVIDFNINYKFAYYQPVPYFSPTGNSVSNDKISGEIDEVSQDKTSSEVQGEPSVTSTSVKTQNNEYVPIMPDNQSKGLGMATLFDQIIQNPMADLMVASLDIIGDPFWIEQKSVLSNDMSGKSEGGSNTYLDNSVLPDDTEVFIRLNFKVPSDVDDAKGLFKIQDAAFFNGIYKVFICESRFEGGVFLQNLQMVRMKAQGKDVKVEKNSSSKSGLQSRPYDWFNDLDQPKAGGTEVLGTNDTENVTKKVPHVNPRINQVNKTGIEYDPETTKIIEDAKKYSNPRINLSSKGRIKGL